MPLPTVTPEQVFGACVKAYDKLDVLGGHEHVIDAVLDMMEWSSAALVNRWLAPIEIASIYERYPILASSRIFNACLDSEPR